MIDTAAAFVLALLAAPQERSAEKEQQALFQVIDRLFPHDTSALPFVRVATGWWSRMGEAPPENTYRHGFLMESEGKSFRIRFVDLSEFTFRTTPEGTPEFRRVGFRPVGLADHVRAEVVRAPVKIRTRSNEPSGFWIACWMTRLPRPRRTCRISTARSRTSPSCR